MNHKEAFERYCRALVHPDGASTCVAIEQHYDLYGYPPEIVATALKAAADGEDMDAAIDRMLDGDEGAA